MLARKTSSDRRIRVMRAAVNGGCDAARNLAIGQARGRYVAFLDDDDLFLPERLEQTVTRLEAEPELGAVFSRFGFIDAQGQALPWTHKFLPVGESATPGERVFEMLYCDWGWIPTCTLTVRAERLAGLAFPEFRRCDNDAVFNAQLAASGALFTQLARMLALVASRRPPGQPRIPEKLARRGEDYQVQRLARPGLVEPADQGGRVPGGSARAGPTNPRDRILAGQSTRRAVRPARHFRKPPLTTARRA
jgi:hypothetical protein